MTQTGFRSLNREIQIAVEWLMDFDQELAWDDRQKTYQAVRATFHALRDRLVPDEAADLASQLPTLLRGVFYDGYKPSRTPQKIRQPEDFYDRVREEFVSQPVVDAARIASCVFTVLDKRMADGEIEDVKQMFPAKLRHLWPGEERGGGSEAGEEPEQRPRA